MVDKILIRIASVSVYIHWILQDIMVSIFQFWMRFLVQVCLYTILH